MTTKDRVQRVQDLRRCNAARPIPSGKQYNRKKIKHKDRGDDR